jgi:hypothetical protein
MQKHRPFSASRARKIYALLETMLRNTLQISEGGFLWIVLYALEASAEASQEQFTWVVSLGGDQEPPPLVEGYVIEPLQKLQALSEQQVCVLPRLLIVGTFPCHILENCQDQLGRPLGEDLHVYNSKVTLARVLDFIHCFYPEIAEQCAVLEFPGYQTYGAARTLFAGVWSCFEPEEQASMARMFRLIRGNVSQPEPTDMQSIFGEHCMPYVGRHLVSNGHFIEGQHILRFGAEHTEPQFWLASCKMRDLVLHNQEQLLATFKERLTSAHNQEFSLETIDAIQQQLQVWQTEKGVQGQMGMSVPTLYYRHEDEPSLGEMICGAESTLAPSTDELPALSIPHQKAARRGGLEKLRQVYRRLVALVGEEAWWDFLADWHGRYLAFASDSQTIEARTRSQQSYLRNLRGYQLGEQSRAILNLELD